jgi:tRNA threonylcarbamoyladenosine biosynthesis protein TsaB
MLLLAIDTSGKHGSIALARTQDSDGDNGVSIIEVVALTGGAFSAQLVPEIAKLLSAHRFSKHDIGAFAVVSGPGSFTGIRVGLSAVKALAEALGKPIAAVSLLQVMVFASGAPGQLMAVMDAGRGDVYVGEYDVPVAPGVKPREYILSRAEFLSAAKGWTVVTPDPAITDMATAGGLSVSPLTSVSAVDVAKLGWEKIQSGDTVTPDRLEANYIRRTDAEILQQARS